MSTIPVELPDDLRHFVEAKVQRGQFASANEYQPRSRETRWIQSCAQKRVRQRCESNHELSVPRIATTC